MYVWVQFLSQLVMICGLLTCTILILINRHDWVKYSVQSHLVMLCVNKSSEFLVQSARVTDEICVNALYRKLLHTHMHCQQTDTRVIWLYTWNLVIHSLVYVPTKLFVINYRVKLGNDTLTQDSLSWFAIVLPGFDSWIGVAIRLLCLSVDTSFWKFLLLFWFIRRKFLNLHHRLVPSYSGITAWIHNQYGTVWLWMIIQVNKDFPTCYTHT